MHESPRTLSLHFSFPFILNHSFFIIIFPSFFISFFHSIFFIPFLFFSLSLFFSNFIIFKKTHVFIIICFCSHQIQCMLIICFSHLSPHTLYQNHEEFRQIFAWNESTVYLTFSFLMHNTSHVCLNPMDRCYTADAILCQQCVSKLVPKKDCLILKLLTKFKN